MELVKGCSDFIKEGKTKRKGEIGIRFALYYSQKGRQKLYGKKKEVRYSVNKKKKLNQYELHKKVSVTQVY